MFSADPSACHRTPDWNGGQHRLYCVRCEFQFLQSTGLMLRLTARVFAPIAYGCRKSTRPDDTMSNRPSTRSQREQFTFALLRTLNQHSRQTVYVLSKDGTFSLVISSEWRSASQKVRIRILTIDGLVLIVLAQNLLDLLLERKTPHARSDNDHSNPTCSRPIG